MNDFLRYQRTVLLLGAGAALGGCVALLLLLDDPRWAAGLAVGAAAGLLKIRLDVVAILRWANHPREHNGRPLLRTVFHTYGIYGGALAAGLLLPETIAVWTVLAGLFLPRAVLVVDGLLHPELTAPPALEGAAGAGEGADG